MRPAFPKSRRLGFSLIELVVVLMIIAILSGLTVSIVGWLRQSADKGTAANIMASLLSNVELYRVTVGTYPEQLDSLLDGSGALYSGNGSTDLGLHDELRASGGKLTTLSLNANRLKSLQQVGLNSVMDHTAGSGLGALPGNSGTVYRLLNSSGNVAAIDSAGGGAGIADALYPPAAGGGTGTGVPANVDLIVFGFGPMSTSIGKTIVSPPAYSGVGQVDKIYNRFLLVFAVYNDGSKNAQLKAVIDSKGDHLNEEITEFFQNKPQ